RLLIPYYVPAIVIYTSYLLISFLCSFYHLYLRSFPTRRSSDLIGGVGGTHADLLQPAPHLVALAGGVHHQDAQAGAAVVLGGRGDRQSTRLNSSHVSISYAVFCVKKKDKNVGCVGIRDGSISQQ